MELDGNLLIVAFVVVASLGILLLWVSAMDRKLDRLIESVDKLPTRPLYTSKKPSPLTEEDKPIASSVTFTSKME